MTAPLRNNEVITLTQEQIDDLRAERDQAVRERDEAHERGARLAKWMEVAQAERDSLQAERE